jgi:hypothetical protein
MLIQYFYKTISYFVHFNVSEFLHEIIETTPTVIHLHYKIIVNNTSYYVLIYQVLSQAFIYL